MAELPECVTTLIFLNFLLFMQHNATKKHELQDLANGLPTIQRIFLANRWQLNFSHHD